MIIYWLITPLRLGCIVILFILMSTNTSFGDIKIGTGVFPEVQAIEKELVRDKSTHADVQKLLGIPTGAGGAMLPGFGDHSEVVEPYDIWYYEDVESRDIKSENGVMVMDMRQQILLIFFKGDKFHGYFWTSNEASVESK